VFAVVVNLGVVAHPEQEATMAHFFVPTHGKDTGHGSAAANGEGISTLWITANGNGTVGVWGGGPSGEVLLVQVWRGSQLVGGGGTAAVKINRLSVIPGEHIQTYSLAGLKSGDEIYGMLADGRRWTGAVTVKQTSGESGGVMAQWATAYTAKKPFPNKDCCSFAIPYLALTQSGNKMIALDKKCSGGPLQHINGLAVHTTAGQDARTPFEMACWGCVQVWNKNGASAHFGIAGDGTLVQYIPTNLKAWAQQDPGNQHWTSVEVDNNGITPMKLAQLETVKKLFRWVCQTYGVPPQLSTGLLSPHTRGHDAITMKVCEAAGSNVTSDAFWSAMGRGLSCHYWLKPVKPCPGPGILSQMASIVKGGPVC
jgi:hypothetical protein